MEIKSQGHAFSNGKVSDKQLWQGIDGRDIAKSIDGIALTPEIISMIEKSGGDVSKIECRVLNVSSLADQVRGLSASRLKLQPDRRFITFSIMFDPNVFVRGLSIPKVHAKLIPIQIKVKLDCLQTDVNNNMIITDSFSEIQVEMDKLIKAYINGKFKKN